MIKVKSFKKLRGSSKKYEITFEKNGKMYIRKFGAAGMSDYTIHKDKERRERYISRHKKDLRTNDPMKPGYLSMYILWNKPSLKASLTDYKRRLNIYNKNGKFPKSITGSKKLSFGTMEDMKNYGDVVEFFRNKTGRDPSIHFIEPQLKRNLKDYSASKISAVQKGRKVREVTTTKQNLKNILKRLNTGREPWVVLDPTELKTRKWLYLAADTLTAEDFKGDDRLWYNILEHILQKYIHLDPDSNQFSQEIEQNLMVSEENIEFLMKKLGFEIDFEPLGDDHPIPWYVKAHTWLTEEWATGNAFGKKYKVPDNVVNKRLYSNVKAKIKRSIKGRRWGAYDSGRLVREYKAVGGKYKGSKGKTNLSKWYKEKWVDACAWPKRKPCGRKTKETIAYCRPSKKVDSKTPKLVQKLSAAQRNSRCARKKKTPMKRITKFGKAGPDVDVGNGWVIHCNPVPGIGPHATLRQKQLAGPERETDWAFRYGIKTRGGAPEFWASGDDPLGPRSGTGLPNVRGQQLLMDYFYNNCGGYNTRQLPPMSPPPGSSMYLNSFGNKDKLIIDKMRQRMYDEIFQSGDLTENVMNIINKICDSGFNNIECQYKFTGLILSIYYTILSTSKKVQNKTRQGIAEEISLASKKKDMFGNFPSVPENMTLTVLKIKKYQSNKVVEFLGQLQDHGYGGTFQNARLANLIHRYILS